MPSPDAAKGISSALRVPHDLVGPFRDTPDVVRGEQRPKSVNTVLQAWQRQPGVAARRDYIAIDESGDFDGNSGGLNDTFLVAAAVHFDVGGYRRLAGMFAPWRHMAHDSLEVKAASGKLSSDAEDMFLDQVMTMAASGVCAVTLGIVDKVSHQRGALMTDLTGKHDVRREFHLALLRAHLANLGPRTNRLRLMIDQCGLNRVQEVEYERSLGKLLDDLNLGGVYPQVDFVDSLTVETVQLADLLAGTVRKMFRNPTLPDLSRLSRCFLVCDLTDRG